ncbi:MAG: hypothetical protein ACK5QX_06825, partial [bacterium]
VGVDEAPYPDGPADGSLRCLNRQAVPRSQRPDATARLLCQPARWHQGPRQVPLSAFGFRLIAEVRQRPLCGTSALDVQARAPSLCRS